MYRKLLLDFMTDEECGFCNSGKTLKIGYLIKDLRTDNLLTISTYCYKKYGERIINRDDITPNLTKGIIKTKSNSQNKNENSSLTSHKISNLEYLILRQEKLAYVKGVKYNGINDIYENYKISHEINEKEEIRLQRFIDSTNNNYPEYSPRNLQKLYASLFWIKYAINKQHNEKSKAFLKNIYDRYKTRRDVTEKQALTVYKVIENLNNIIDIKKEKIPRIELNIVESKQ